MKGLDKKSKKISFFVMIMFLIATVVTFYAKSTHKRTDNLETNLGGSTYNIFDRDTFINTTINTVIADHSSNTHIDCVGFVEQVIRNCGGTVNGGSTVSWYNGDTKLNNQYIQAVAGAVSKGSNSWAAALNNNGITLMPGDIVVGVKSIDNNGRAIMDSEEADRTYVYISWKL